MVRKSFFSEISTAGKFLRSRKPSLLFRSPNIVEFAKAQEHTNRPWVPNFEQAIDLGQLHS